MAHKENLTGLEIWSVVEHLPSMHTALGSMANTAKIYVSSGSFLFSSAGVCFSYFS